MPHTGICVLLLLLPWGSAYAQGAVSAVPPGREVRQQKLLSPTLTDVWKLDVEADEVLGYTVDSAQFDPVLELYDVGGERLGTHNGEHQHAEL